MAKKKLSAVAPAPAPAPAKKPSALARGTSLEDIESLRTLNSLLLKETVERRGQVDVLRSQMAEFTEEHAFLAGVELEVGRLLLSACVADLRSDAAAREAEADRRRREMEVVEEEVRSLFAAKAAAEGKVRSLMGKLDSTAEELRKAEERSESVAREKGEVKKALDRAVSEKEAIQMDLDRIEKEKRDLGARVRELEMAKSQIRADLGAAEKERDDLLNEVKEREEAYRSLMREKASLEGGLEEYRTTVERLKSEREKEMREKQEEMEAMKVKEEAVAAKLSALEAEHQSLVEIKSQLDAETTSSKCTIDSLKKAEEGLRARIAEMEEKEADSTRQLEWLREAFAALEKEKKELMSDLQALSEDYKTSVDNLKHQLIGLRDEKEKIAEERALQETEIGHLKKEVARLQSSLSELQDRCQDHVEKNTQLQAERDSALRLLGLQEEAAGRLVSEVDELKKSKDEADQELQKTKAALNGLLAESEGRKAQYDSLVQEISLLKEKLTSAQQGREDAERRTKAAEVNSERALDVLKSTTETMLGLLAGDKASVIAKEIGKAGETRPFAERLEEVKTTLTSEAGAVEDVKQELDRLQRVAEEAQKKNGGLWSWLYPALSTLFAAISLAYASRNR